jgi:gliding motility-associated-like protein
MRFEVKFLFLTILVFQLSKTIGQKCPKLPIDKVTASLVVNDNGKIYDSDTILKLCLNSEVKIFSNSSLSNVKYWFNYEGDSIPKQNGKDLIAGKFKFDKEGTFLLIQQGELGSDKTYSCKVLEVLGLSLPAVTAFSCVAKNITLQIPNKPDKKFDKFDIAWGDGQNSTINKSDVTVSHTYSLVQTYFISFTGKRNDISCSSGNVFQVKPDGIPTYIPTPSIKKLELDEKGVSLNLTSTTFIDLSTNILQNENGGSYQTLTQKILNGNNQINTITNLDSTKQYCYKLQIVDACNNKIESGEICTINLNVKPEDTKNKLSWTVYPTTINNYDVLVDGNILTSFSNNTNNTFTHTGITCGQKYCYQVKAKIGAIESISQKKCINGKSTKTLLPITDGLVSIDNNNINLKWTLPSGVISNEFSIKKSDGVSGIFSLLKKTNLNNYTETFDEKKERPCYQLSYTDNCNNVSPQSESYCPVILKENSNTLIWDAYEKFLSSTVSLEVFDTQSNLVKTINANGLFTITPQPNDYTIQNLVFRVKTTSNDGRVSYSNSKPINFSLKVLVPSAFTPNGDGVNDTFKVFTSFIKYYSLKIFDRWGNVVFMSQDPYEEWNGNVSNGQPIKGEFIYTINAEGQDGTHLQKTGAINIIF